MAKLRLSGIFREPGRDKKRRKRIYIPILVPQPDTIPSWSKLQPNVVAYVTTAFESAFSTMDLMAQRRDKKIKRFMRKPLGPELGLCTLRYVHCKHLRRIGAQASFAAASAGET
jgi:hypothetical protein